MTFLAPHIEAFLRDHLVRHRGASQHTCDSYAYSFQSLFEFASRKLKVAPSALMLEQLDAALISSFLEHLETARGNSAETRNIRLAALRSFFRFLQHREPAAVEQVRRVLAIPFKKPTLVWCLIWSRKKCRPCSTLLIHPRGKGFETGPCCILRCALGSESQS
jgi:site-specific recombinase XerC